MSLLTDIAQAVAPKGAIKIEDFSAKILSPDRIYIYYTLAGHEVEKEFDMDVDYCSGEKISFDSPGYSAEATITDIDGISQMEQLAFDEYEKGYDLEPDLLEIMK